MRAHLKKNAANYGIIIALATSITGVILDHFFPAGDSEARQKVTQSHEIIKETVSENNKVIEEQLERLERQVNNTRARLREAEDRVSSLEDQARYYHGNRNVASAEQHENNDDINDSEVITPPVVNKMRDIAPLEKF